MPTPFPGMDPYLEHPDLWPDVHHRLITYLADYLAPRLRPRYRVKVEVRVYGIGPQGLTLTGRPDVAAIGVKEPAATYDLPERVLPVRVLIPDIVEEGYLVVQEVQNDEVVTVVEVLSPTNKRPGQGRRFYEIKRMAVLNSLTHLVEIDLIRAHEPLPVSGNGQQSDYRILISRSGERPSTDLYPFDVRDPIPIFPLPLRPGDEEPLVDTGRLLHDLYDRAGYDLSVDYSQEPKPPLEGEDAAWLAELLAPWRQAA